MKLIDIKLEDIYKAVSESYSKKDVLIKLGFDTSYNNIRRIEYIIYKNNIDISHFTNTKVKYNKEMLEYLVLKHDTMKEILLELGLKPLTSTYKTLKNNFDKFGIDYTKFGIKNNNSYNRIELEDVVVNSKSLNQVLRYFKKSNGGNFNTLKKYLKLFNIDYSHFNIEKSYKKSIPLEDVLVKNSSYSRTNLKKRLYDQGILKRECCLCGQDENWNGMKISLIIDHINGVNDDNRIENLRIVCPNCNAGLDTFAGKNNKKVKDKHFCDCGEKINNYSKKCIKCSHESQRKVERPSKEVLLEDVKELGYSGTGRKYGVSDNSIRKWLKAM